MDIGGINTNELAYNGNVVSNRRYPRDYTPRQIKAQIMEIANIFQLSPKFALELASSLPGLPKGAESWFAIVKWKIFSPVFSKSCDIMLDHLSKQRTITCKINPRQLELVAETETVLENIAKEQKGDILIIPGQLGLKHRGEYGDFVARQIQNGEADGEFGGDVFSALNILMTHPLWIFDKNQLFPECIGSICDGRFPILSCNCNGKRKNNRGKESIEIVSATPNVSGCGCGAMTFFKY